MEVDNQATMQPTVAEQQGERGPMVAEQTRRWCLWSAPRRRRPALLAVDARRTGGRAAAAPVAPGSPDLKRRAAIVPSTPHRAIAKISPA